MLSKRFELKKYVVVADDDVNNVGVVDDVVEVVVPDV
jgi:hypothetical protein